MKSRHVIVIIVFVILSAQGRTAAGGPFGPPQPIAKETGGYHTAIGYWFHEDRYKNGTEQVIRQNQVYSELGYGSRNDWEIYRQSRDVGSKSYRFLSFLNRFDDHVQEGF